MTAEKLKNLNELKTAWDAAQELQTAFRNYSNNEQGNADRRECVQAIMFAVTGSSDPDRVNASNLSKVSTRELREIVALFDQAFEMKRAEAKVAFENA